MVTWFSCQLGYWLLVIVIVLWGRLASVLVGSVRNSSIVALTRLSLIQPPLTRRFTLALTARSLKALTTRNLRSARYKERGILPSTTPSLAYAGYYSNSPPPCPKHLTGRPYSCLYVCLSVPPYCACGLDAVVPSLVLLFRVVSTVNHPWMSLKGGSLRTEQRERTSWGSPEVRPD